MAKISKSASRSVYIASEAPYQGSMTVWALRDFVRALDAEGIPDGATLTAEHAHDTRHFIRLSVSHNVDLDPEAAEWDALIRRQIEANRPPSRTEPTRED